LQTDAGGILFPAAQLQTLSPRATLSAGLERTMPMEMTGEFRIDAPRQRVWEGLNDPEILKQCIPGCQSLEKVSDTEFNGRVVASVGPVRATFGGKVTLSDLDPPQSYTISGEGSGGVAGFAKGGAKVNLAEAGTATLLSYAVQAQVGGKLAQVGSRLIDGVARKMANDFFGRFADVMAPEQPEPAAAEPAQSKPPPIAPAEPAPVTLETALPTPSALPASSRLPPAVWVTGLAVIIILLLYFFTGRDTTH
jgi:carbon monoxide dehydrogenase subunit G